MTLDYKTILNKKNMGRLFLIGLLKKLLWVLLIYTTSVFAQKENKHIRSGNDLYAEDNFKDAEVDYMKALEKNPESVKGQYNLGNALYKQENFEDANKLFASIAAREVDNETKANAYYNLGNSFVKAEKFPEAIESYKNALRLDPSDMDTKYNLQYAQNMLKQQQSQDQQKPPEPSEFAKKLKEQADELVRQFKFGEAYQLMVDGLAKDKTVAYYQKFIKKIEEVVKIQHNIDDVI